jgi:S1-C subfamily serine protease
MAVSAGAQDLADLFARVAPAVVTIRAQGQEVAAKTGALRFKETGSGVLISPDGTILTAAHVVHAMDDITVEFASGEPVRARVVASEPNADLSLLEVEHVPAGATVALLADSDPVRIGQQVMVVGAPYGLGRTMSVGWIGGRHAPSTLDGTFRLAEFFQTDAAINTGNSGGPMFDGEGRVIGVVSHMISKSGGSEGLGFAVTSRTVRERVLERGAYWTGAEFQALTGDLAALFNLPQPAGLLIKTLAKASPLAAAGLRAGAVPATVNGESLVLGGDVILAVRGVPFTSADDVPKIRESLRTLPRGAPVPVKIFRAGRVLDVTVTLP